MSSREGSAPSSEDKVARARAVRAEHARPAQFYANRVEQAHAASRRSALVQWTAKYRRAAARCRLLGEMVRSEREAA